MRTVSGIHSNGRDDEISPKNAIESEKTETVAKIAGMRKFYQT